MKKINIATVMAIIAALLIATVASAMFGNGNFETGDFTGWVKDATNQNGGILVGPPPSYVPHPVASVDDMFIVNTAWMDANFGPGITCDPYSNGQICLPFAGSNSAVVNYQGNNGNLNKLTQSGLVAGGDIGADGNYHIFFTYAPVLDKGSHTPADQPFMYVKLTRVRSGSPDQALFDKFSYPDDGNPNWKISPISSSVKFMPWQVYDLTYAPGDLLPGDTLTLEVVAAGCVYFQGAHWGYVYVDEFGPTAPAGSTAPSIFSVTPSSGPDTGGTSVTITGTNFTGATAVSIGTSTLLAGSFTIVDDTHITFTTPANPAGIVDVSVINPGGSAVYPSGFTYLAIPAPTIGSIVPNSGPVAGGTSVVITGTNLTGGTVTFGGTAATCTVDSPTQITCTSPAHTAGAVDVVVTTPGGPITSTGGFTYTPTIYSLAVSGIYGYLRNNPAMDIATGLTATSTPAGGTLDGAIALIGAGFQAGDVLAATDSGGVTSSYNTANGVLTLTGTADVSVYQTVLGSVKFSTSSTNAGARTVDYTLGAALPSNPCSFASGHFYDFVPGNISWTAAQTAASGLSYFGQQGYLTTVTCAAENAFISGKLSGEGWMGASDAALEGTWNWVTGPEAGTTFCSGPAEACAPVGGAYTNWNNIEPNDAGGEDYGHFLNDGSWNDYPLSTGTIVGYVVEYGGMAGDTPMDIEGSVTVNVTVNTPPVAVDDPGYSVHTGTLLNGSTVLVNDTDAESNPLSAFTVTSPSHASSFTFNANGTFSYTPTVGYVGTDSFTYKANDGTADSVAAATVTINVTNTAPIAIGDGYSVPVGTLLNGSTVLVNDTDADAGDTLTAIQVSANPAHASAFTFNANGTFAYTPAAGFSGQDTFTYKANDGTVDSNTVTVTINVVPTLTVTASGPATVKPGDQYVYTLAYTVNATTLNTQVAFTLPGHTTYVSNTGGYACAPLAGVVTCDLGTVSANGSFTVTVAVDKLKKINTPLTLNATAYSINSTSAVLTNGSATVTANTLTPFADVTLADSRLDYVQSIWAYGITSGCLATNPLTYCPNTPITRAQMAVFIERGIHGGSYDPGILPLTFTDTDFAKYWIEALRADGITAGCNPGSTRYCPDSSITRAQMAVFLLRGKYGASFVPSGVTVPTWTDVPLTYWASQWTYRLGTDGISNGCGSGNFCPDSLVSRGDMAVLVQRTFNLPMPTP